MSDGPSRDNLTGCWEGLYTYARCGYAAAFGATLIDTPGWLTGTTHEICSDGPENGALLCAFLEGHRSEGRVSFVKTYDGSATYYSSPVHYEGAINADGTEIEGVWRISPDCTGRFLMVRSGRTSIEEKREAFEKAK